ncbi:MAG: hypothetical protein IT372_24060 [Polyangiaceae bacterium]|nr:hypothetical protein [Polyangiaceae bacterium]
MRSWIVFFALCGFVGFAAAGGCSEDKNLPLPSGTTGTVGTGAGGGGTGSGCNGNGPDGFCNLRGNDPETCACPDCEQSASCRGVCTDDGSCTYDPGSETNDEDCTCDDCYGQVSSCPPFPVGCPGDDDPSCTADEDCTCPDCTNTPRCTDGCVDNGSCVEYLEGCSCSDCAQLAQNCGGNPTTTTTTTSGGGGAGGGGAGGAGGAGGS